jgi:2-polyprenyl-3-methyl-5-hydroxy-6-metoxy-1,4-benzoquinol methylase
VKPLDRLGQRWRIAKARRYVAQGSRVLDIGCADGALFRALADRIRDGIGIDPNAVDNNEPPYRLIRGSFPEGTGDLEPFDAIVALAVLEHVPTDKQPAFASACYRLLRPGGHVVLTVPSPLVDRIVHIEQKLHLADGMELHEHFGFEPEETVPLFREAGLEVVQARSFQLRLNHLFVFRRPSLGESN